VQGLARPRLDDRAIGCREPSGSTPLQNTLEGVEEAARTLDVAHRRGEVPRVEVVAERMRDTCEPERFGAIHELAERRPRLPSVLEEGFGAQGHVHPVEEE